MYKHSQAETHCAKRGKAWQAPNMSWRCLWKESLKRQVSLHAIQFLLSTIYQGSGDCRNIAQNPNPSWCNIAMIGVLSAIHPAGPHPFSWPISWIGSEEWLTKCTLGSPWAVQMRWTYFCKTPKREAMGPLGTPSRCIVRLIVGTWALLS
jgi:hypothetical protein